MRTSASSLSSSASCGPASPRPTERTDPPYCCACAGLLTHLRRLKSHTADALNSGKPLLQAGQTGDWVQFEALRPVFSRHLAALRRLIIELQGPAAPSSPSAQSTTTTTTVTVSLSSPPPPPVPARTYDQPAMNEELVWLNTLSADQLRAHHRRIESALRMAFGTQTDVWENLISF